MVNKVLTPKLCCVCPHLAKPLASYVLSGPPKDAASKRLHLTSSHEVFQRKLVELEFPIHTVHELLKLTDGEAAGTKTGVEMVGGLVK